MQTAIVGILIAMGAVLIATVLNVKSYFGVLARGKIRRDDYRRLAITMGVLGIVAASGGALMGGGMVSDSPGPNPLSEYVCGCLGGFGVLAGLWLMLCLSVVTGFKVGLIRSQIRGSHNSRDADSAQPSGLDRTK
jgi:hypothetical protein